MKKALLWLGSLACLAFACLYAYAWFTRDPLVLAFEHVRVGMSLEEAEKVLGRPPDVICACGSRTTYTPFSAHWRSERHECNVRLDDGRVESKKICLNEETVVSKVLRLVSDPASLWRDESSLTLPSQHYLSHPPQYIPAQDGNAMPDTDDSTTEDHP